MAGWRDRMAAQLGRPPTFLSSEPGRLLLFAPASLASSRTVRLRSRRSVRACVATTAPGNSPARSFFAILLHGRARRQRFWVGTVALALEEGLLDMMLGHKS